MFPEDQMLFTLLIQIAKRNYWFRGWLTNLQWETEVNLAMSLHVLARLHCQCISSMSWGRALLPWEARWSGAKELMARWGLLGMEQKPLIVGTSLCCNFFFDELEFKFSVHIISMVEIMLHPCLNSLHLCPETVVQIQCNDDDGWKHSHFKIQGKVGEAFFWTAITTERLKQ